MEALFTTLPYYQRCQFSTASKKDLLHLAIIVIFVLFCCYFSAYKNFTLWGVEARKNHRGLGDEFLIINITCNLFLLAVNYLFMEEKRNDYYQTLNRNIYKKEKIEDLTNEIKTLRQIVSKEVLSDENFKDLLQSISMNEFLFLEKFEKLFPYFKKGVSTLSKSLLLHQNLPCVQFLNLVFQQRKLRCTQILP